MGDNRQFPRKQVRISAAIKVFDAADRDRGFWLTRDIGTGGMFLQMDKDPWPLGTEKKLLIQDQQDVITCAATVVRLTPDGVGLKFLTSTNHFKQALLTLIQSRFTNGDNVVDRRKVNRFVLRAPVLVRVGIVESPGTLVNANMQGAYIEVADSPPPSVSSLMVSLPVTSGASGGSAGTEPGAGPAAEVLGCKATIVHRQPDGVGVEFVEPSPEFQSALSDLIARADEDTDAD